MHGICRRIMRIYSCTLVGTLLTYLRYQIEDEDEDEDEDENENEG